MDRYCPESKRNLLNAIEEIIIVKPSANLVKDEKFGLAVLIE